MAYGRQQSLVTLQTMVGEISVDLTVVVGGALTDGCLQPPLLLTSRKINTNVLIAQHRLLAVQAKVFL